MLSFGVVVFPPSSHKVINFDYRFTGRKEAGINENSSYYILTQCEDGAFEAVPIHNWYNFTADIKYQTLTADEAEEEFGRREKTVNYFSLMVKKRLMDNKEDLEEGDEKNMLDKTIKAASRTGNLVRNKGWGITIHLLFNLIKILIMAFPISTFQFNKLMQICLCFTSCKKSVKRNSTRTAGFTVFSDHHAMLDIKVVVL